ncbi:MAG: aminopeptidase P family protein [Rhodobacteraceae bacterium]|nr:aminopeptidase P family protein [Paracoccaceae bacterium]
MLQSFDESASPEHGPSRLSALRSALIENDLDGFLVPRSDVYQGEYVAPCDERLAWLTGFTGSAGFCVALRDTAGIFVDSRYRVQVRDQVASVFSPIDWPETSLGAWVSAHLSKGTALGFDPWLHSVAQLRDLEATTPGIRLRRSANLVDAIWADRPDPPLGRIFAQPVALSGEAHEQKIKRLAASLGPAQAAVITLPDSIAWLLNIRGSDIPRNPVPHAFAILRADDRVSLFVEPTKVQDLGDHLGPQVDLYDLKDFERMLPDVMGPVQIDPTSVPVAVFDLLQAAGVQIIEAPDPCILPKACKTETEIEGTRIAHQRDGAAMVRFLAWLDAQPTGSLTEIDVVRALEDERRATNALRDISFDTISGSGPNGAIVHYRVTEKSNRRITNGDLLLIDSGGQYVDGTTDITRTVAIGEVGQDEKEAFTRVLKGMIAVSRVRWPKGLAGRDLDALARVALWEAGQDYGHGTGHGVGSYLCVHEGPQRLSRSGTQDLLPGMILSNEPGFYKEGAFGIRIENLILVQEAERLPQQTVSSMLTFETLTYVPLDRRLILTGLLTSAERTWIDRYHETCAARLSPLLEGAPLRWLTEVTQPL